MAAIPPPEPKAQVLLGLIARAITARKMTLEAPETLLTYTEAVELLGGQSKPAYAGAELQKMGLRQLSRWTASHAELPKVDGLIVARKTGRPGVGFLTAHGYEDDEEGEQWWREEAERALQYDWSPYLAELQPSQPQAAPGQNPRVLAEGQAAPGDEAKRVVAEAIPGAPRKKLLTQRYWRNRQ